MLSSSLKDCLVVVSKVLFAGALDSGLAKPVVDAPVETDASRQKRDTVVIYIADSGNRRAGTMTSGRPTG